MFMYELQSYSSLKTLITKLIFEFGKRCLQNIQADVSFLDKVISFQECLIPLDRKVNIQNMSTIRKNTY